MEFKSLKNIETSFRQIRLFTLVFLGLCAVVAVFSVVKSYQFAQRQREKIYVLDQGKSLCWPSPQDLSQNRPVEAREHVRRFHELFFTPGARPAAIESNINRALFLCDKSAYHYSQDLQEKGYYNRVVAGNINQQVQVDSVVCDFDTYPYRRDDLRPADDHTREQRHRTLARHALQPDQLGALGQQSAGLHDGALRDRRKPRPAGHSTINYDTEMDKMRRRADRGSPAASVRGDEPRH